MKKRFKALISGLTSSIFLSAAVHAGTVGGLYWAFVKHESSVVADLDLSMSPLMSRPENKGGGRARRHEEWFLPAKHKKAAPPPPPAPEVKKEEIVQQVAAEEEALPCEKPCAEGDGSGGGGTGEGHGQYVPASETSRKPRWIGNFITTADYPLLARQNGKDGRVILQVYIDNAGVVRDVLLLQGAYEPLNEVALRKVRLAKFTPAYDASGNAVSCKVTLPIRFELR